ncbi:amino acid dehydrogenase [Ventosimonas gracilis]|uniref:Amino acid dehydrogenase n=1 Tax=Ventosimonas gracilis TaxID=1680762 RepID=A0A139SI85_9GAMM|nr:FAD-binding oxidoreductase [Ventosimonas gracilis]KXU34243.1 amino acid dehydrogenase [Ventosimonas gracilis]
MSDAQQAIVIGGGIVGICCALYLQRENWQVTLIDPAEPGDSTAKWSCGQIAVSEVIPLSKPGILKKIPGWLLDQTGPLALRPKVLPAILPWFLRFIACARQHRIREIAKALASLTHHIYDDYAPLLDACEDKKLLGERPVIELFGQEKDLIHERAFFALRKELGFKVEELNETAIAELEPALAGKLKYAVLLPEWRAVADTEGFIAALTTSFIAKGGKRILGKVNALEEKNGKASAVLLASGEQLPADTLVLAAGNGSKAFFRQLGINKVPLAAIGGYQAVLPDPQVEIRHSIIYADGGFCFTPMTRGLQIGGTIEFAGNNAQPNFNRAQIILDKAKKLLPQLNTEPVEFGVGWRPFLPDTKPIIDKSPRLDNVLLAFGHGQLGLALGATTGRLIAELALAKTPSQDLTPFRATRF